MSLVFAAVNFAAYGLADWAIFFVILIFLIGVVYIMCQVAGVQIPGWFLKLVALVVATLVCIAAIKLVAG